MQAIVLTFDRLPVSFLGCYGSSIAITPNFDRLASQSVVYDQHYAENADPNAVAHAWNSGCFHFPRAAEQHLNLPDARRFLTNAGIQIKSIHEIRPESPDCKVGQPFQAVSPPNKNVLLPFQAVNTGPTARKGRPTDGNSFAEFVAAAEAEIANRLENVGGRWLMWLHARGLSFDQSPPRELARRAIARLAVPDDGAEPAEFEEEELPSADHAETALHQLPDDEFDEFIDTLFAAAAGEDSAVELSRDEWRIARAVLAASVESLDESLGRLLAAIAAIDDSLLIVTAAAGLSAGERAMMALPQPPLLEELTHTPLLVRLPGNRHGTRRQDLVQTVDLVPTLFDFFQLDPRSSPCEGISLLRPPQSPGLSEESALPHRARASICLGDAQGNCALRTPDRYLVQPCTVEGNSRTPPLLFVKPDDVWDVHDVAAQSPDEVESLSAELSRFIEAFETENRPP